MTDRMFYEQDILEGLTKKTFYDSPRIVLTDLEQSLLEKTTSLHSQRPDPVAVWGSAAQ
jgi:hypothetical protein